jgi:hypothetical protein
MTKQWHSLYSYYYLKPNTTPDTCGLAEWI